MPLSTFTDFVAATKVARMSPPNEILNEAVLRTHFLKHMTKGTDPARYVRTGRAIKDDVKFSNTGTFQFMKPGATFNPVEQDTTKEIEVGWRFSVVISPFNDATVDLNEGDAKSIFFNYKKKLRLDAVSDHWDGSERALFAVPTVDMEDGSGERPPAFSIPAFVNGQVNGLPPGFTTIMGINPANEDRWRPQLQTYDASNPASETTGLFTAMDELFLDVHFESPEGDQEYFQDTRMNQQKIITNRDGVTMYRRLLRGGNDQFTPRSDPAYQNPMYSGIPVRYIAVLDEALLDLTNGTAWAAGQPGFYFLNLDELFPVWHPARYMEQVGPVSGGIFQPFSHAIYWRTYYNIFCRSRQRQGFIQPIGQVY